MDRQLITFLSLAYAWTWAWQAPLVLGYEGPLWIALLAIAGVGPSLAAGVVTRGRVFAKAPGRTPWLWWGVAALVPLVVRVLALVMDDARGLAVPAVLLSGPGGAMLVASFGEEFGWRGFLQPRLSDRFEPLVASLITGSLWGLWHLPTALYPGAELSGFWVYWLLVTAGGVWMGWLYEASGKRVSVAIVAHAAINSGLIATSSPASLLAANVIAALLAALALRRRPR